MRALRFAVPLLAFLIPSVVTAQSWVKVHDESFDGSGQILDGERLGTGDWLVASVRNGASLTRDSGSLLLETPDFPDSALLRIRKSMPDDYVVRVRLGEMNYGYMLYEQDDYDDPAFKYNRIATTKLDVENGFYWLTITDRIHLPTSGEEWWHKYRKIVIDSDDHLNQSGTVHTETPLYLIYMNPDLDRDVGSWIDGHPELLRSWSAGVWHTATWNWEYAHQYDEAEWYSVQVEKSGGTLTMSSYDASLSPIEVATPVDLDLIYAMGQNASPEEFVYIGEPHVDSYEGSARIDRIEVWFDAQADADGDGVADPFDNCVLTHNPQQTDGSGGSDGDACDDADGAIFLRMEGASRLTWEEELGFESWNVYRGSVAALRTGGTVVQDPLQGGGAARFCGLTLATLDDPHVPASGTAVHYVVAGTSGSGEGGLGVESDGTPRLNAFPCP